ncbi:unnamed protein product [Penicillium salamii]|uniref:Uncharacterized protein n=1 Tax=Penicillium salamii TaxID=1612424 RepID=A0A9W4IGB2_9EURO|nr:unnamed protein product [Penicillium salamii]
MATADISQPIQPQSTPQYTPQDGHPAPSASGDSLLKSHETAIPHSSQPFQSQSKPEYNSSDGHFGSSGPNGPAATGLNDTKTDEDTDMKEHDPEPLSREISNDGLEDEVLVDLKKLSIGQDQDGNPDAWSRLGRSLVLLVRYGPYKAAKYRVQTANGYNAGDLQKVSNLKSRISHVTYIGQDGEEHKRYTRNNIVGIVGVAIQERKDTTRDYKSAPTVYVKIKWQDIDEADQKLLARGCGWITNADLVRLTDRATAAQKISDAWGRQEERYNHWQRQMGRDSPDRSPTPCPLDAFREDKNRTVRRGLTAAEEALQSVERGPSESNTSLETPPSQQMLAKRPVVKISEPSVPSSTKKETNSDDEQHVLNKGSVGKSDPSEQLKTNNQVVTFSVKTYFQDKAKARGWDWDKMSVMERNRKEDELLATYRFYKSQMELLGGEEVAA